MHLDTLRDLCLSLSGTTESTPFGPDTLVFKVGGKIYALTNLSWDAPAVNLKGDPERSAELRATYSGVRPGYHMNKTHWNTVDLRADVPAALVRELVEASYGLVVAALPRAVRAALPARAEP